ncbi:sodium- and chloride-dependent glycine transporter 1 [Drosophila elegans]|uniref:sodium- and chloride-dependent glycine transporter 1 n=1 Tax=Drosophila elegans TaxID=30023 RepID=UPI0007E72BA9|nr:sodium- and chloride-dependent glycine transporter 1 [Drosophila elegans]
MANQPTPTQPPRKERRIERDENRGQWTSKWEFVLSLMGYAIGIGNVWRFPYLCYRSGGAAFLIPYMLMVILVGIPLFYMEILIGQFSSTGCTGMFRLVPLFKGTGIAQVVVNAFCVCYYSVIISYPIRMISYCFFKKVPWEDCHNPWNTDDCVAGTNLGKQNSTEGFNTASDEFFHLEVLRISSNISELGGMVWQQLLSLLVTWIVVYLCLIRGIKSVGKVVYFTVPFPYILLFILLVRGVTLPGAWSGIKFYLYPEWHRLLDLKVWADAAVQMFFGIGPGWGGLVNMASFSNFRNNAKNQSILIVSVNVFTSIFAGFVVFSVLGFLSEKTSIPVEDVATGGAGLAFVTYPEAIAMLPVPQLWALMFFAMLFLLGIDSVFVQLESIMSSIQDEWAWVRKHKWKLTLTSCFVFFALSSIMCTNGGMYILQLFDWYSSAIAVIVICLVEIIMVAWIYGIKNFMLDTEFMLGKRPSLYWRISWQIITPLVLIFILITSIVFIRTITYNGVSYPDWAVYIGWASFAASVMWIPLYIFYIMIRKRATLCESLKKRLKPLDWTPADPQDRADYEAFRRQRQMPAFMSDTDMEGTK